MKRIYFIMIFIFITLSGMANGKQEILNLFQNELLKADSIELHFFSSFYTIENSKQQNDVIYVITRINIVNDYIRYLSKRPSDCPKCGFDGTINFLKNGQPFLEDKVYFTISCNTYNFMWMGKNYCAYLGNDASIRLKELYNSLTD